MKILDISMKIFHHMEVYKGKESKRPTIKVESDFISGSVYESKFEMNLHTGTHLDMPLHILQGGDSIDQLDLNKVVTNCKVFDFQTIDDILRWVNIYQFFIF